MLRALRSVYKGDWHGYHGVRHWYNVRYTARYLQQFDPNKDYLVSDLFALFHDAGRVTDGRDPGHGVRGVQIAYRFRNKLFKCTDLQFARLEYACIHHSKGLLSDDIVIGACWNADRMDLPRVGIDFDSDNYMCESERMAFNDHIYGVAMQRAFALGHRIRNRTL